MNSHYDLKALDEPGRRRWLWAETLNLILERLNALENYAGESLSRWYGTDPRTGVFYGDPAIGSFAHLRIDYTGSPERCYIRERVDQLREKIGAPPFPWKYTPGINDFDTHPHSKCGTQAAGWLEMLQAIGRRASMSADDMSTYELRYSKHFHVQHDYDNQYGVDQTTVMANTETTDIGGLVAANGAHSGFHMSAQRSTSHTSSIDRGHTVNAVTKSSGLSKVLTEYQEIGESYGVPADALTITFRGKVYTYSLKEAASDLDYSNGQDVTEDSITVRVEVIDTWSGGHGSAALDWVETEGAQYIIYVSPSGSVGLVKKSTLPAPVSIVSHDQKVFGSGKSAMESYQWSKRITDEFNYGWRGNPYGSTDEVKVSFEVANLPAIHSWMGLKNKEEITLPTYNKSRPPQESVVAQSLEIRTSDTPPKTLGDIYAGEVITDQSQQKRYVWYTSPIDHNQLLTMLADAGVNPEYDEYAAFLQQDLSIGYSPPEILTGEYKCMSLGGRCMYDSEFNPDYYGMIDELKAQISANYHGGTLFEAASSGNNGSPVGPDGMNIFVNSCWGNLSFIQRNNGSVSNGGSLPWALGEGDWLIWTKPYIPSGYGGYPINLKSGGSL